MKKEMIIPMTVTPADKVSGLRALVCASVKEVVLRNRMLLKLSCCYTRLLGERVSPFRTLRLLHAQSAFFALTFPMVLPLSVRLLMLGWFAAAVLQCKRSV